MINFKANSVEICGGIRGNSLNCVSLNVDLDDQDAEKIIWELWKVFGDDWLKALFLREGFTLTATTQPVGEEK